MQHLQFPSMTNLFSYPWARLEWQVTAIPSPATPKAKGELKLEKRNKRHPFLHSVNLSFCNTFLLSLLILDHCGRCCGQDREKWQHPCPLRVDGIPEEKWFYEDRSYLPFFIHSIVQVHKNWCMLSNLILFFLKYCLLWLPFSIFST